LPLAVCSGPVRSSPNWPPTIANVGLDLLYHA